MSGVSVQRAGFDQDSERIVAVGTIGSNQRNGILHFWGTGVDAERNAVDPETRSYLRPPNTEFHVHALRGPNSARTLRAVGIDVPEVFGDPVWMLPRFWPMAEVKKRYKLGVILHLSELAERSPQSKPKPDLHRYGIPEGMRDDIHIINTLCEATYDGLYQKVAEIVSCDMIVSTSLHGLVIAETYGIPCCWFATYGTGEGKALELNNSRHRVEHRVRDFYSGVGRETVSAYCLSRSKVTHWDKVMDWVGSTWTPLGYDDRALIEAFPVPLAVSPDDRQWALPSRAIAEIQF